MNTGAAVLKTWLIRLNPKINSSMQQVRYRLAVITLILLSFGLVMVYSASAIFAWESSGESGFYLKRHLVYLALGFFLFNLVLAFDYRRLKNFIKPLTLVSLLLLVLVLIPGIGSQASGARRWFKLFSLGFQPSEFTGLVLVIYFADFLSRKQDQAGNFIKGILPMLFVLGAAVLLVLMQPDLGTAVSFCLIGMIMFFVSGMRLSHLAYAFFISVPFLYFLIFSVPYRRRRILSFLDPWADPLGSGFQIIQSQIALASGGIFGLGLGNSKQKLFYLPAAHTDFIFSIIAEELGLLGSLTLLTLFGLFLWQGIIIAKNCRDDFGKFLAFGITAKIVIEACINIGVNVGLLPTKGLPLPFISYGGSSLLFDMISVALLINIARYGTKT